MLQSLFLQVSFDNEKQRYWTEITEAQYNGAGLYQFEVSARNLVSGPFRHQATVIIEEEIKDLKLKLAKDTIEVNETISVETVRSFGTSPLFAFVKGNGEEIVVTRAESIAYSYILQGVYTIQVYAK